MTLTRVGGVLNGRPARLLAEELAQLAAQTSVAWTTGVFLLEFVSNLVSGNPEKHLRTQTRMANEWGIFGDSAAYLFKRRTSTLAKVETSARRVNRTDGAQGQNGLGDIAINGEQLSNRFKK